MFNTRLLSLSNEKCAYSSTFWQFFYYRPPSKFWYTAGRIAKISDAKKSIYIDIYRYKQFDNRYGFSISIGNTSVDVVDRCQECTVIKWVWLNSHCNNEKSVVFSHGGLIHAELLLKHNFSAFFPAIRINEITFDKSVGLTVHVLILYIHRMRISSSLCVKTLQAVLTTQIFCAINDFEFVFAD